MRFARYLEQHLFFLPSFEVDEKHLIQYRFGRRLMKVACIGSLLLQGTSRIEKKGGLHVFGSTILPP